MRRRHGMKSLAPTSFGTFPADRLDQASLKVRVGVFC